MMLQPTCPSDRLPLADEIARRSVAEWGKQRPTVIIGRHALLDEALDKVARFASSESAVLLTGETGTGKELFARAVFLNSRHHRKVFISINCAQYCGTELVASELFGHCKGAFTGATSDHRGLFEAADGGTIFLDEIGDLPISAQAMLLRTLSEGEVAPVGGTRPRNVNVRVIAATSRELKPMIAEGSFRSDLYYRLRQLHVQIPPLRDRGDDWEMIAGHYLDTFCRRSEVVKAFSGDAVDTLRGHSWPGNVREVRSVVDTGFHMSRGSTIGLADFCEALEELARDHQVERFARALIHECCARMATGEQTFWEAIHRPFLDRDLNREQVRDVVSEGLRVARGSYKRMLSAFGVAQDDYLKFMDFLRHHDLKPEEVRGRRAAGGVALLP